MVSDFCHSGCLQQVGPDDYAGEGIPLLGVGVGGPSAAGFGLFDDDDDD
jgi:hypothetical protein